MGFLTGISDIFNILIIVFYITFLIHARLLILSSIDFEMEKTNLDKINSFLAHLDSQYEKLNDGVLESATSSSFGNMANSVQASPEFSAYNINHQNRSQVSIHNQQNSTQSLLKSSPSPSPGLTPEKEIEFDIQNDPTNDSRTWCEKSLEQLEMTIQLLDQCLDNDLKELNRQQGVIKLCQKQIEEVKIKCSL